MNKIIKRLDVNNCVVFILQTESDPTFWWWEVSASLVERYQGTDTDFVNDVNNSMYGCSCGSFTSANECEADYLNINP